MQQLESDLDVTQEKLMNANQRYFKSKYKEIETYKIRYKLHFIRFDMRS